MSKIAEALKQARKKASKRNFVQSVDIVINLKNVDIKKPENKFKENVLLPKGRGKPARVCVIGTELASKAGGKADVVVKEAELAKHEKSMKDVKKLVNSADFFIAEPSLMARLGKSMGRVMGPRNKMPRPLPPQADPSGMIESMKNSVTIAVKDSPVIHCTVGSEKLSDEDLEKNISAVLAAVQKKLPSGEQNVGSVYVKLTMGPAVKV